MSKFLYPIYKLKIPSFQKWWLYRKTNGEKGVLSEILEGDYLVLNNSLAKKFNIFEILGNTFQDGTPTPENPISIQNVVGIVNTKIQNKNLARKTFDVKLNIVGSGDIRTIQSAEKYRGEIIEVEPNTTYTASGDFSVMDNSYIRIGMLDDYPVIGSVTTKYVYGTSPLTFTTDTNTKYILLYNSANIDTVVDNLQIEQGGVATNYVEHKEQNIPFSLRSKNLFDKDGEVTRYYINNSGQELIGTDGDTFIKTVITDNIASNYVISYKSRVGSTPYARFAFFNGDTFISRTILTNNNASVIVPANTTKIDIRTDILETKHFEDLQIEAGTEATEYEPYYNYELSKIEDAKDYFYKENGKWYLHKKVNNMILDNTKNWIKRPNTNNSFQYSPGFTIIKGLCSHYTNFINGSQIDTKSGIYLLNTGAIIITDLRYTDLEDFKTFIGNNNVEIEFYTSSSTDTEITETTLINQLEAIKQAQSYADETIISGSSDELSPIYKVQYYMKGD